MLKKLISAAAVVLMIAVFAYAGTVSQQPYGQSFPYWYGYSSGAPTDYYLSFPTLSANDEAVGKAATQTLTNKTLVNPTITGGFTATGLMTNDDLADDTIKQTKFNRRFTFEEFETNPVTAKIAGGAAGGTGGDENVMIFEDNIFEYHMIGTQTIVAPSITANGLNISLDEAENDGVEYSQGITARSRSAFVIGTDAFYVKAHITIADVSGTDDFAVGFRTAEAYQAAIDDYNNMAVLNVISGNIYMETIDDNGATTSTDTTDDWGDTEDYTIAVYVSDAGVVTYKIDGADPSATAEFTFDDGDTVVPFIYLLHDANVAEDTILMSYECGLQ